jgi:hypothetical protein
MGACLTVVEFFVLLLLVPFYWPLIGRIIHGPSNPRHHHEADDREAMLGHWLERQPREPYGQRNKDAKNLPDNDKTRVRKRGALQEKTCPGGWKAP